MDDLELIKQKINIVDLIQEYFPLKKTGVNFKANCPFHQEKTPSFVVSPERGIWHCFGCDKGGDIFKFLMEKEGMDFPEALETLAKRAGITLKNQRSKTKDKKERLYEANQKAAQFFHYILTEHKLGKQALEYLHNRGISDETIKQFQLGYAPNSWESLCRFLKKRGFAVEELVEAGLAIPSARGGYDRFRGRVIFPLVNVKNEVVGFAGRILGVGEPKYLNTPVTPLFDKSRFLFGLNLAKGEARAKNQLILVEGLMDMVASYQAGIKQVVATQGTALTVEHVELVKKYTDIVLLCFDKDLAGDAASRRGIELLDQAGLNIRVVKLSEVKDPAEAVQKNPALWSKAVEEAEPIYDYYLSSVAVRFPKKDAESKRRIAAELLPIWGKITDPITLDHYTQKLAAMLGTTDELLGKEIKKAQVSPVSSFEKLLKNDDQKINLSRQEVLEKYLLALLLHLPTGATFVPNFPETIFLSETHRNIYVLLVLHLDAIAFKSSQFNISEFVKTLPDDLVGLVDQLYLMEIEEKFLDLKDWQEEVKIVVTHLKRGLLKASLEKLSAQIKNAQAFGKIEALETLNRRFRDLSVKLKSLQ